MSMPRGRGAALLIILAGATTAHADCPRPGAPADDLCRPWSALLLPTVVGTVYAPSEALGPWIGGGLEVVLFAWSDSSPAFGPSQGKLRFDIGLLGSSHDGAGTMVMYRGGAQVSLERNASRRWLIPYVAADLGGLWTDALGGRGFVDGGVGIYLWHARGLVVDIEGAWVLPFSHPDQLAGPRTQLELSFSLW